jgi:TatD DNase family protein
VIDTHCHLYDPPLGGDVAGVVRRAGDAGVNRIIIPGVDARTSAEAVRLAESFPGFAFAAVGVHPQSVECADSDIDALKKLAAHPAVVAIGETGLDAEVADPPVEMQEISFRAMLKLALEADLPVLIHCRGAFARLSASFREDFCGGRGGVLHAWAGSVEIAQGLFPLGFSIGVAGVITRPSAVRVRRNVGRVPLDRMVLETDSPYIGTALKAKGAVEPADVAEVCAALAAIKKLPFGEVEAATTANAERLFFGKG